MKKILIFLLMLSFNTTFSQIVVNDIDINALQDVHYVQLDYVEAPSFARGNKKGTLIIDYGQDYKKINELIVKDKSGKIVEFNSMIDVLNFFSKNGWGLFSTYHIAGSTQQQAILERR